MNGISSYIKKTVSILLMVGLIFFATVSFAESPGNDADWLYTVNRNDSYERIYQKYLIRRSNILALSQYNKHKLSKKLQPGQIINIPLEMLKRVPANSQILLVSGEVFIMSDSGDDKHKANNDDLVSAGMTLQTAKNSLARLRFADGSIVDVQQNSMLKIQSSFMYVGKSSYVIQIKLVHGRTEISANPNHEYGNQMKVETPSAVAAVRGTQFRVGAEGDLALQETLNGQVAFSSAEDGVVHEVLLDRGYGSIAEKNKAPLPPIALPDAPDVATFPTQFESLPIAFNLKLQNEVVAWVSQLALDADFTKIVNEQETETKMLLLPDLSEGTYYLRLRAKEKHGLQGRDSVHEFNVNFRPPVIVPMFELMQPVDEAVIPLAPNLFIWTPSQEAEIYILQIARDVNFENKVFEGKSTSSSLTLLQSFGSGVYYWRVATMSHGKLQKFSNLRKFMR